MEVTVTGASGHIGANLIRLLLEDGHRVRALVHRNRRPLAGADVEVVTGDVVDPPSLERAFAGAEVVFHLAGVVSITGGRGGLVRSVNVAGASNVAVAARRSGVRRLVHCSSIHAFDLERCGPVVDEASPRLEPGAPGHPEYDSTKAAGERAVRQMAGDDLELVVVYPTSVVGPWDFEPSRVGRFLLALRRRRIRALVSGGFDFVDVRDVGAAMITAASASKPTGDYLLSGRFRSIAGLAADAWRVTGVRPPRLVVPRRAARLGLPFAAAAGRLRRGDPLYTPESIRALGLAARVEHAKAAWHLGHSPRPLAETIADTYEFFDHAGRAVAGTDHR